MDAHEILAAGSPQAIPQGDATFARDEVSGWIVKHLTERHEGSCHGCLRIKRNQIGSQEPETELQQPPLYPCQRGSR